MNEGKIPVRYAKALLDLTEEKKLTDQVYKDILYVNEIVKLNEVKEILQSPVISGSKKNHIIKSIIPSSTNDITLSFLNMVFIKKRETYLESITRIFISKYKELKKIKTVEIITAVELEAQLKENFNKEIVKNYRSKVELETKVDPDIVGGFIIQVDDKLYDASVKNQLKKIRNTLINEKL